MLQIHLSMALRLTAGSHVCWHRFCSGSSMIIRDRWLLLLAPRGPGALCSLQNRGRLDRGPGGQRTILLRAGTCRSVALQSYVVDAQTLQEQA